MRRTPLRRRASPARRASAPSSSPGRPRPEGRFAEYESPSRERIPHAVSRRWNDVWRSPLFQSRQRPTGPRETGTSMQRDLVLRARTGDHDAFSSLATEAYGRLHRIARLILRREDLASDAVQEALTSAWLHIRAVRDPDRFEAWLNRLVARACYAELKRARGGRAGADRDGI